MKTVLKVKPKKWTPHDYQRESVMFLLEHAAGGLWLDPGLGKTVITLTAFAARLAARTAHRMLVIAPMRVCRSVWPKEAAKWTDTSGLRVVFLHGPKRDQMLSEDADVFCINPEGLAWLLERGTSRFSRIQCDILAIDEVTKFKHTNTQRFKLLKPFLSRFRTRWTLTGTPAPNGLMDIFGQIYCLDLGHALGGYITAFRNEYFDATGFGDYTWALKEGSEERIYEKVRPLVLRIGEEVLTDLPKLIFNDIKVELPADAMRAYKEMETHLITMLNDGTTINAVSAGTAAGKCLQICNGGVYYNVDNEDFTVTRKAKDIHSAKLEALDDLLEEINHKPALVLYSFDHDKERLKKAYPGAPCVADLSDKACDAVFDKWNRGEVPILLAQSDSIAHGLNLQGGGQHIIWFGMSWNLETWLQAIKRLHRQGSEFKHIFCHTILAEGTIDETVRAVVRMKDANQNALLNAVRTMRTGMPTTVGRPPVRINPKYRVAS